MTATIITIIILSFLLAMFTNSVFFTETFDEVEVLKEAQEQEFDFLCNVFMKA